MEEAYSRYQEVSKDLTMVTLERQDSELAEYDVEAVLNYCMYFMENALELWEKATVKERFRFQSLIFPSGITYSELERNQTPRTSLIYEAIRDLQMPENLLAEEIGRSWNTLIPYMEQIAALMQERLDSEDMRSLTRRLSQPVLATL